MRNIKLRLIVQFWGRRNVFKDNGWLIIPCRWRSADFLYSFRRRHGHECTIARYCCAYEEKTSDDKIDAHGLDEDGKSNVSHRHEPQQPCNLHMR